MLRKIGAVVLGIIAGFILIATIEYASSFVYPRPTNVDASDRASMEQYMASLPAGAFAFVLVAYFVGTLVATSVAALVGRSPIPAYVVGFLLLCAGVANIVMVPHPNWFSALSIAIFLVMTFVGARFGTPRPPREVHANGSETSTMPPV